MCEFACLTWLQAHLFSRDLILWGLKIHPSDTVCSGTYGKITCHKAAVISASDSLFLFLGHPKVEAEFEFHLHKILKQR